MSHPPPSVRVTRPVDGVSGTALYEAIDDRGEPVFGRRLAVIARMHGNEPVGDPVLARLNELAPQHLVRGSLLLVRANEEGAALDQRHTPGGTDMNRLWDTATQQRLRERAERMGWESLCYEEQRALQLAPLLLQCAAILDLHSTSRPAAPFLVMRDDQAHAALALGLGVQRLVTGLHENAILSGGVSANVGLMPAERGSRLGFTFEAGQHTDPENAARAWEVTVRYLAGLGVWEPVPEPTPVVAEVYEVIERFKQAGAGQEPYRFVGYEGGEAGGGRRGLPPRKLHSFEEIQADEVILRRGRNEVVRAHIPFTMLMPAPATPPDTDLYYVTQPRQGGLTLGVPRTDEQARREAMAIERMLDLLSDDEFERGTTWVAFDSRRLYDLCANVIGRALRLEPGHPHRRIAVMGRGDIGGDDAERRAGHRYRDAMRHAIAQGLPIERIQLLRGAPLAWIDALTSPHMSELIARRRQEHGQVPGARMRISLRQPHTASLMVGGDLERALEKGDTRHVRVVLLIEAAVVEPDGGTARVRVSRAGLVSTRPEVLSAASSLLRTLREEHRYLVRHGALKLEPAIASLLCEDDALEADPDRMEALRQALYRVQLQLWCDQLRSELTVPEELRSLQSVGQWLARTMNATGILDADALSALVIRPLPSGGFVADPELLEALAWRLQRREDLAPLSSALSESAPSASLPSPPALAGHAHHGPPQPLFASEVGADDLERWVSWTRFVRGVQVVPETRGKDLDLAFSGADIRERLVRWWDGARREAARRPGELMVVVAGDGLNPLRDQMDEAYPLYRAHRAVVLDPNLHYLRIQHAQGTHLSWMKDFLATLARRPAHAPSAALHFEVEHGATASVILVLERDLTVLDEATTGSLDGWDILCCGVVLSDLESLGVEDYKVGLFTERRSRATGSLGAGSLNLELAHFGRAHCEGLISQMGVRARVERGPLGTEPIEEALVEQIARWIERVRAWRSRLSEPVPRDLDSRAAWVASRLGLADARLARVLGREMDRQSPPLEAARALWASVPPWPGPAWHDRADLRPLASEAGPPEGV